MLKDITRQNVLKFKKKSYSNFFKILNKTSISWFIFSLLYYECTVFKEDSNKKKDVSVIV